MKKILFSIVILSSFTLLSFDIPTGWFIAGNSSDSYNMGVDIGAGRNGKNAATIQSVSKKISGFGTLMQNCLPDKYIGKRIRLSGYLKTQNVEEWAGFWLRIEQANNQRPLAFDNMQERPVKATSDWQKYEIVLDVTEGAANIAYGASLYGIGQIWFDDLTLEIVDNSVPLTGSNDSRALPHNEPINLDFEE